MNTDMVIKNKEYHDLLKRLSDASYKKYNSFTFFAGVIESCLKDMMLGLSTTEDVVKRLTVITNNVEKSLQDN